MGASLQKIIDDTKLQDQLTQGHKVPPHQAGRLHFAIPALDQAKIYIPMGAISEWGLPSGKHGRRIMIQMLKTQMLRPEAPLCLWIHNGKTRIYPPTWAALGVDLQKIYFAESETPIAELRPVFLEPLFKIIVIDRPKKLSKDDCAFLASYARLHQYAIVVLRDFFLSERLGNPYTQLRINAWYNTNQKKFHALPLRGAKPQPVSFSLPYTESSYER